MLTILVELISVFVVSNCLSLNRFRKTSPHEPRIIYSTNSIEKVTLKKLGGGVRRATRVVVACGVERRVAARATRGCEGVHDEVKARCMVKGREIGKTGKLGKF
ncbi:hypothetical protein Csa_000320 [Cucumis sativus]|uniref:Uncharacterized protein n=1 Tax=Cucumis sativus TaxID=3659 RepID=A0A0A0KJP4_CUCSA|nr:hypothetical protein Csa_000320 [Cucumis sativus]